MVDYSNPFLSSIGGSRSQLTQPQNQHDFSGWGDRLNSIEQGIASLTEKFNNLQTPTGTATNTAAEPLEQSANEPLQLPPTGIESLVPTNLMESMTNEQNTGFNYDPQGGSLQSQLAAAYGGQTHEEQMGRAPAGFTQGFSDFFTGEGYYADPRSTWRDGPWSISDTPIDAGPRMGGVLDPYGNPQNNWTGLPVQQGSGIMGQGTGIQQPQQYQELSSLQGPTQQSIGSGINGLAAYQQNNRGAGI
jgi:hypothetical protein